MYGQNQQTWMPDYSNYALWDRYMGSLWHGLIASTNIGTEDTLVEIAPGATSKIACALSHMGFAGRLFIVEPHPEVGPVICAKSRDLLPQAEVILIAEPFGEMSLSEPVDAVLANHIFDDLISAYATPDPDHLTELFQDIANESPTVLNLLKTIWKSLSDNPTQLARIKQTILSDWLRFIHFHSPKTVILSQYTSSYFEKHGLSVINTHAQDLFHQVAHGFTHRKSQAELQALLNQNENYGNPWIGEALLNAEHWMIDER